MNRPKWYTGQRVIVKEGEAAPSPTSRLIDGHLLGKAGVIEASVGWLRRGSDLYHEYWVRIDGGDGHCLLDEECLDPT